MSETLLNKNSKYKFILIVSWTCVQTVQTSHNSINDNWDDGSNDKYVIDIDNNDSDDDDNNSEENYSGIN
jgi:hypothetical protein